MSKITLEQKVKLFSDEEVLGTQSVHIDLNDVTEPWMSVIHDGSEISLSLENWNKLNILFDKSKKQLKIETSTQKTKIEEIETLLNELHNDIAKSIMDMKIYNPLSSSLLTIKDKVKNLK